MICKRLNAERGFGTKKTKTENLILDFFFREKQKFINASMHAGSHE
jgi:hypothetical protein